MWARGGGIMDNQHPDPSRLWKHRRRLAYWSMGALTVAMLAGIFGDVKSPELVEGICWVFGIVVVSYYGGNAAEALATRGRK